MADGIINPRGRMPESSEGENLISVNKRPASYSSFVVFPSTREALKASKHHMCLIPEQYVTRRMMPY